jgi:hypothetical protein
MMTFHEWRDELERRYNVMPRWYWDNMSCRDRYQQYCDECLDKLHGVGYVEG